MSDKLSSDLASLRIAREERRPSGNLVRNLVIVAVLLAVLGVGYVVGLPLLEAKIFRTEIEVTEIALVSPAQASVAVPATGYIVPQKVAKVGAKVPGRVAKVLVSEGDRVKAGQVLFELDPTDQKSAVATAQARVAAARARAAAARANVNEIQVQLERNQKLVASGAINASTVEDMQARIKALEAQVRAADAEATAAQAEVNALNTTLGNMTIVAPMDGMAVNKPAQVGDVATQESRSLVELADFDSLLVEADIPESRMSLVKIGGPAEVVFDAFPDRRLRGEVVQITPRLNRAKATGTVKVKILDDMTGILPEMSARVSFLSKALDPAEMKEPPKKIIPAAAIADRGGAKVVFIVNGGKVKMVNVTLGEPFGSGFVLKDGPPPGTKIVKGPPATMVDGTEIKERSS
jgi:RND family efflux transporter MFP subunit